MDYRLAAIAVAVMIAFAAVAVVSQNDGGKDAPATEADGQSVRTVCSPAAGGTVRMYDYDGTSVTLTAAPADGYTFSQWLKDGTAVDGTSRTVSVPVSDTAVYTAVFVLATGERIVSFDWKCPSYGADNSVTYVDMTCTLTVSPAVYEASLSSDVQRRATLAVPMPSALVSAADPYVMQAAAYLEPTVSGMTETQRAYAVLRFVQDAVDYRSDIVQYGTDEFWATPTETLYSGLGDCEDTSILLCSLYSALGMDSALVAFQSEDSGHMGAAVSLPTGAVTGGASFEQNGREYVFCETTADGIAMIGVLSSSYNISDAEVSLIAASGGE